MPMSETFGTFAKSRGRRAIDKGLWRDCNGLCWVVVGRVLCGEGSPKAEVPSAQLGLGEAMTFEPAHENLCDGAEDRMECVDGYEEMGMQLTKRYVYAVANR